MEKALQVVHNATIQKIFGLKQVFAGLLPVYEDWENSCG